MRRAVVSALFLLAASSVVAAPAPFVRTALDSRGELSKLQGTWMFVADYDWDRQSGEWFKRLPRIGDDGHFIIKGCQCVWCDGAKLESPEAIRLHPETTPKGFDLTPSNTSEPSQGIYKLDGDTLTIVCGTSKEPRPSSFDKGFVKWVLRRKKP